MATAKSMILDMLKTPQQVREEQMKGITSRALGMRSELPRASTGIPGMITNLANQSLVRTAEGMAEMPRRLSGAAGAFAGAAGATPETQRQIAQLGLTGQEIQAQRMQDAMRGIEMGNLSSMKQALKRLEESGAPMTAVVALSERIAAEETKMEERAALQRGEKLKRDMFGLRQREVELEEAKYEAEQKLKGTLGQFDLSTEVGVNEAVETLMAQNEVALAVRLKNAYKKDSNTQADTIQWYADNMTNGDMEAARQLMLEGKGGTTLMNTQLKRLNTDYDKALASKNQLVITNAALRDLDQTDPILGSFAGARQGVNKLVAQVFGLEDLKQASVQTEALLAKVRNMSAEKLGSGIFGSGTGISEKDMEEAKAIAGASENLTAEGMAFILRFNAKLERAKLMEYNKRVQAKDSSFWSRIGDPIESYLVDSPELYLTPVTTENAEQVFENPETGETILLFQNRWYNPDGTFYARNEPSGAQ